MGKQQKKEGALSSVKRFVVTLFLGGNLATLVLLWLCCASTWIDPEVYPRVSVLGLAFPVVLLLNMLFIPLWLIYKPRMLLVPILGMALCGGFILDYFPLRLTKAKGEPELTVLSWNTCTFAKHSADSMYLSIDYLMSLDADVMCFQELDITWMKYKSLRDTLDAHGYHFDNRGTRTVVSRYPILRMNSLVAPARSINGVLYADLLYDGDTLSVLDLHLESNGLSKNDKNDYSDVLRTPEGEKIKSEASYLSGKIAAASSYRAGQIKAVLAYLDSLPENRSILVCGDFNDTPISYVYQKVGRRFKSAFRAQGRGVGLTFNEKIFPVRIDHIFYSAQWECTSVNIDRSMTSSDHYPLVARLRKRQK